MNFARILGNQETRCILCMELVKVSSWKLLREHENQHRNDECQYINKLFTKTYLHKHYRMRNSVNENDLSNHLKQ